MKPSENGEVVPAKLAATVLMVRDGPEGLQVFMVVRHRQIEFASGALVFPGGKVEPEDVERADGDDETAARIAAIRETHEECGVLLVPSGGSLADWFAGDIAPALDALTLFAHWITPPILPKRFDTRFYIAAAPEGQAAVHDGGEAVDSIWIEPARALAEADAGRYNLVLPTRLNLELLGQSATTAAAIAAARARRIAPIEPVATKTAAGYRLAIPADAGYGASEYEV